MAISEMVSGECEEVVLEAEVSNTGALALYRSLGFIRDKHLHRCGPAPRERLAHLSFVLAETIPGCNGTVVVWGGGLLRMR
jgi:RimJ/RimL family protein N-acetyltransferase